MASKRFVQSLVNWAEIFKRMPETEKTAYFAFKAKSDGYLRRLSALPVEVPKINWAAYRTKIDKPGLVDDFEKIYNNITIPFPQDKYTAIIDKNETETNKGIEEFKVEADAIINECETRVKQIEKLLPFDQMTYEDAAYIAPEYVLDMENKPSFWPHQEIDYVFDEPEEENQNIQHCKRIDGARQVKKAK